MRHLSEKTQFSGFLFLQVVQKHKLIRWGRKIKYILLAYFLGNMCAKNYCNQTVYVNIIASQRRDVFWGTVYIGPTQHGVNTRCVYIDGKAADLRRNWMHPTASACTGGGSGADCPVQSLYPMRRCWWRRKRPAHAAGHYLPLASDNDRRALPPWVACSTLCSLGPARPIGARSGTRWFFPLVCGVTR